MLSGHQTKNMDEGARKLKIICSISTHSWRSSRLWRCVRCHFQAEWLSAAKSTLPTLHLSNGSEKKAKLNVCLPFASSSSCYCHTDSGRPQRPGGRVSLVRRDSAGPRSLQAHQQLRQKHPGGRGLRCLHGETLARPLMNHCHLPLTHHQSNLAELSAVQCRANTCCIVSSVISWEPNWDFFTFFFFFFSSFLKCILTSRPGRRALCSQCCSSAAAERSGYCFIWSEPAGTLCGDQTLPNGSRLPEVRSGPLWSRPCVFVNLFYWTPPPPSHSPSTWLPCCCHT